MVLAFDIRGLEGNPGGKGIWTASALEAMLRQDQANRYLLFSHGSAKADFSRFPNATVIPVKGSSFLWHWMAYREALKRKADVFIATESYLIPFLHNPKKLQVATVVHDLVAFRSPVPHQKKATRIERLTLKRAAKKSRWIFAVSQHTKADLVRQWPNAGLEGKSTVVHAGVRDLFLKKAEAKLIIQAQQQYGVGPDYLLMAGTLEPRKNIVGAIEAYSLLPPEAQKRCPLAIAGKKGWYYQSIFERVEALGLKDQVLFLGYVPDEDLAALMQGAKLFLFPSFYEGFGLPVAEAMANGVPVLTSPNSSLPEVGGDAVCYADPHDPADMAKGMLRLLEDEDYRQQLREKGLEQAKKFSWELTAQRILGAIRGLEAEIEASWLEYKAGKFVDGKVLAERYRS